MELWEAMEQRHSVRAYQDRPIAGEVKEELEAWIAQCNREGGLHMQLILDEPRAFSGGMARYGKFSGVRNYIAVVGPKGPGLEEACGYYGEKVVLKAQQLGLNTCWVALTYRKVKTAFTVAPGEKLCLVIAIGYGKTAGQPHQGKPPEAVMQSPEPPPGGDPTPKSTWASPSTTLNSGRLPPPLPGDESLRTKPAGPRGGRLVYV